MDGCRSEIAAIQAGAERRRRKALTTAAVVGITCCSALQVRVLLRTRHVDATECCFNKSPFVWLGLIAMTRHHICGQYEE